MKVREENQRKEKKIEKRTVYVRVFKMERYVRRGRKKGVIKGEVRR